MRKEEIFDNKTNSSNAEYILQNAKNTKIEIVNQIFESLKIEIVDVETNETLDFFEPTEEFSILFLEGINSIDTPFEFFKSFDLVNGMKSIFLPNASLQILLAENRNAIQYIKTNILRNKRKINNLKSIEKVDNYKIKAGENLDEEIANKIKIIAKITNKDALITRVARIKTLGIKEVELESKNY